MIIELSGEGRLINELSKKLKYYQEGVDYDEDVFFDILDESKEFDVDRFEYWLRENKSIYQKLINLRGAIRNKSARNIVYDLVYGDMHSDDIDPFRLIARYLVEDDNKLGIEWINNQYRIMRYDAKYAESIKAKGSEISEDELVKVIDETEKITGESISDVCMCIEDDKVKNWIANNQHQMYTKFLHNDRFRMLGYARYLLDPGNKNLLDKFYDEFISFVKIYGR